MDTTPEIPGYTLEKPLDRGNMAAVYLAVQQSLERRVALKLMAPSLVADETFRGRFLKEGKIVGQLSHPHIITIHDIGVHQTCYYMAVKYVSGGTLKDRIKAGLSVDQAIAILRQIGDALGYAHKRGFVHRDVKPANILFRENGSAVLSDFGIAKAFANSTQMTGTGDVLGTPSYMSPEQVLGKTADARSDLYSLGVVFYEMLTGEKPFQADDVLAMALMHVNRPVPRLPPTLARFQKIIDRSMAKELKDRYPSAEALIAAIDRVYGAGSHVAMAGDDATRVMVPAPVPAPPPDRRRLLLWALGLGLIPIAGVIAYLGRPASLPPEPLNRNEASASIASRLSRPPARPPLDEGTRNKISMMLKVAASHQEVGYLTDPPGSNHPPAQAMDRTDHPDEVASLTVRLQPSPGLPVKQVAAGERLGGALRKQGDGAGGVRAHLEIPDAALKYRPSRPAVVGGVGPGLSAPVRARNTMVR